MKQPLPVVDPDCVSALRRIENRFLQVLVNRFRLRRTPCGANLHLEVAGDDPAIWNADGKLWYRSVLAREQSTASAWQHKLAAFLTGHGPSSLEYDEPSLPMRFVSGGVLPVVRRGGRNFYVLVYREWTPIGWNLANGGSDSRQEMLNPFITAEREMREELIITSFDRRQRLAFDMESENPEDMPEHVVARKLWAERLHVDLGQFQALPLPIKFIDGPDSLDVRVGEQHRNLNGCFLNIQFADGGIEIDRIAKLLVDDDAVFLDGEILNQELVGSVVGLFEVGRMNRELRQQSSTGKSCARFLPDLFFYDGLCYQGADELEAVITREYLPRIARLIGSEQRTKEWHAAEGLQFDLCPVTRSMLERAATWIREEPVAGNAAERTCDIFISHPGEDRELAQAVDVYLRQHSKRNVFFSPRDSQPSFATAIDRALESAGVLVAIASRPELLRKRWLEYEVNAFHVLHENGRKADTAAFVPYVAGFEPRLLPLPLLLHTAVEHDFTAPESSLRKMLMRIESLAPGRGCST